MQRNKNKTFFLSVMCYYIILYIFCHLSEYHEISF